MLLFAAISTGGARAACDTSAITRLLDQANQALKKSDLNNANLYTGRALRIDPTNQNARYTQALVMIAESKQNPPEFKSGLAMLTRLESELPIYKSLPSEQKRCAETERLYSVFNTIGVEYYKTGDMKNAEYHFLKGEKYADGLSKQSAQLDNNLALLYQNQLNLDKAAAYYQKAQGADTGHLKAKTRFDAIRQIQSAAPKPN